MESWQKLFFYINYIGFSGSNILPFQYLFVRGVCHEEYEAKDSVEVDWFMLTGVAQEWSLVRGGE